MQKGLTGTAMVVLCSFLLSASNVFGDSYYVSSTHPERDDTGPGTEAQPWATIRRVNQQLLEPGDSVKFKRGDRWNLYEDEGLQVSYSGSETAKIEYTFYGEGSDPLPLFYGGKEFKSDAYQWTQSNGIPTEYYLEAAGGGPVDLSEIGYHTTVAVKPSDASYYPAIHDEDESYYLLYNPYQPAETFDQQDRLPGTLTDDMWGWGRHEADPIDFNTIYIRCYDGNPDDIFSSIIISQYHNSGILIDARLPIEHITINGIELRHIGHWSLRVLRNARNIEISNVVCKFNYNGIDAWGADSESCLIENDQWGNTVNNCYLTQNTLFGIAAFGCGSFDSINNNECRYNHKHGIFVNSKNKTYVVERNDIHHNGIEHKEVNPQYSYWGLEIVQNALNHYPIIRYNAIHHNAKVNKWCGDGGGINIKADNARVYYNLSYLNDGPGIGGDHMDVDSIHYGAKIYNNVFYNNCQSTYIGCAELKFKDILDCTFKNNIVQKDPWNVFSLLVRIDNPSNMVFGHNCYYSPNGTYEFWWGLDSIDNCSEWLTAAGEDNTSFCSDPHFTNDQQNDFHLTVDSPCTGGGCSVGLVEDYEGNPVTNVANPDIGAYNIFTGRCDDFDCTEGVDCDRDCDGVYDQLDNCLTLFNPNQADNFPPGGNGVGDDCECEADFNGDGDVDATDAYTFKRNYGRTLYSNPCSNDTICHGDFDCDQDVDGSDASVMKSDFGRSTFANPCPQHTEEFVWCVYQ